MSTVELAPSLVAAQAAAATVGAEEEHLLVAGQARRLVPASERLLRHLDGGADGRVAAELCAQSLELISPVCASATDAAGALRALRARVRRGGGSLLASGVHPTGGFMDRTFSEGERYEATGCALAGLVRTPTCALHVHVGMPDPETMIRVFNGLRAELPLLLALSANSPFWHGADSGLASARTALLRSYPRSGIPQPLPSFEAFLELEERLRGVAEVEDYTHFWWDVRPHPRLGTIEVRVMDVQTRLDWTEALIALVHGLVAAIVAEGARPQPAHEAIEECAFRAARYGVDARLADADGVLQPVPALAREAVDRARRHLPDDRPLDGIASLVAAGGGAQRQRAAFAAGGMRELLRMLISETEEPCLRPS